MRSSNRIFFTGNRYLIGFLAFLSSFGPLSSDLYLPAMPLMASSFHADEATMGLTISCFMVTFALSMLFWGPLSEKYGRRPVLIVGSILYMISSGCIASSSSIYSLIFWRIIQAIGGGATSSMSLAIVKDVMHGSKMEQTVAIIQTTTILAPILAPLTGSFLLMFFPWRGIFFGLVLCGLFAFLGALALRETRKKTSLSHNGLSAIAHVLKHKHFVYFLITFSLLTMPVMAYIEVSAFIFEEHFSVSSQEYSLFFGFNGICALLGTLAHMYLFRKFDHKTVITTHIVIMTIAGLLIILFGSISPWDFAFIFATISFCGNAIRPVSTVLMMRSVDGYNGIVASLIGCCALSMGSLSMVIAALPIWPNNILAVGIISFVISSCCLIIWHFIKR